MPVSQISPSSLASTSSYVNPTSKAAEPQSGAIQQGSQDALKTTKAVQTDTVTISQQALQKTSDSSNNKPGETQNSTNSQQPRSFSTQA
jgi:hypothetical protein